MFDRGMSCDWCDGGKFLVSMVIGYKFITGSKSGLTSEYFNRVIIMMTVLSSVRTVEMLEYGRTLSVIINEQLVHVLYKSQTTTMQGQSKTIEWYTTSPLLNIVCCFPVCFRNLCDNRSTQFLLSKG